MSKYPLNVKKCKKSAEKNFFCQLRLTGQNAKKRTFFQFVMHFLFRKMRWGMKKMLKKSVKNHVFFYYMYPKH